MRVAALWNKEMKIGFASPVAYVAYAIFLFIAGLMFFSLANSLSTRSFLFGGGAPPLTESLFRPLYHNLGVILLMIIPAVTMRLFAEERRTGTLEVLLTYPIRDLELLLGKFLAALSLYGFLLVPTLLYPFMIHRLAPLEWGVIGTQYLGLLLLGGAYLAVGLWASNVTDNQIVAAISTVGLLLGFWLAGWMDQIFPTSGWAKILGQISILNHFENFSKGIINSADLSFYLLFIAFFLYLTYKGLESRQWRGAKE